MKNHSYKPVDSHNAAHDVVGEMQQLRFHGLFTDILFLSRV